MAETPLFVALGAFRCCHRELPSTVQTCSRQAHWMTHGRAGEPQRLWCAVHSPPGGVLIAGELLVRRVSLTFEAVFCGTSADATIAQSEAVARLEDAIVAAGGVLNVVGVTSVLGRYVVPADQETRARRRG